MNADNGATPTRAELQAYGAGKLDARRAAEVEAHLAEHPERLADVESAPDDEVIVHLRGAGSVPAPPRRPSLLDLAVEAVLPVLAGCAGAVACGAEGGLVGVAVGQAAEKAINFFGRRIIDRWLEWLRRQPPAARTAALAELADVTPEQARSQVAAALALEAPQASDADRKAAADYLGAIPHAVRQSLLTDRAGGRTPSVSSDDSPGLLRLLPASLPPYAAPCDLPGAPFRLEELIGSGGFGAVYRAHGPAMQNLPVAIKFCLDRSLVAVLRREDENLTRLIEAGRGSWSPHVVRLYGRELNHATPFLVYEYVCGGDLVGWLAQRRALGRPPAPAEVLGLISQVAEGLAFAHERGLVHRDVKPANVLIHTEAGQARCKLADFGIGGVARRAAQTSRIGTAPAGALSLAEQASLFRGAGTPLYADLRQKGGEAPDPRHDLYSLGVTWYQLLVGDVTREMSHGWEDELREEHGVPPEHVEAIRSCVGVMKKRPRDAGELLKLLRQPAAPAPTSIPQPPRMPAAEASEAAPDAEAQRRREEVVRALIRAEKARPNDLVSGLAYVLGALAGSLAVLSIVVPLSNPNASPLSSLFLSAVGAVPLAVMAAAAIARGRRRRTARAAAASAIEAAQAALSLPPVRLNRGDHDKLCQAGWVVVRQIERRLKCDVKARVRFAGTVAGADFRLDVHLDGGFLGGGGARTGFDLPAVLCRGTHYLEVRSWTGRGPAVVQIPDAGDYVIKVVRLGPTGVEVVWAH